MAGTPPTLDLILVIWIYFPLELLTAALVELDLESLTRFRRVNQRAMEVVDSIPQYNVIVAQAPNALRGFLIIRTGQRISCRLLFDKLCTAECEYCGDFGDYLDLLSCKRVCYLCIGDKIANLLKSHAMQMFGLDKNVLATIPQFKSVPGRYSPSQNHCSRSMTLVDYKAARRAGLRIHGSRTAIDQHVAEINAKRVGSYQKRAEKKGRTGKPSRRLVPDWGREFCSGNVKRWMVKVRVQHWNKKKRSAMEGFHCVACRHQYLCRLYICRRKYTAASFKKHIKQCGEIQNERHVGVSRRD